MGRWRSVPLWTLVSEARSVVLPAALGPEVFHYSIPALEAHGDGQVERTTDILSAKLRLHGGEVLISKLNPRKSRVVISRRSDRPVVASTEFVALRPRAVDPQFLFYILSSETTRQRLDAQVQSVTRSHQRVDPEDIMRLMVSVPEPEEQRTIANFLDAVTARATAIDDMRKRQLAAFEEKFLTVVKSETGRIVAWNGSSGGNILPLRRVVKRIKTGSTPPGAADQYFTEGVEGLPWIAPASFGSSISLGQPAKRLSRIAVQEGVPVFESGSTLVVGIGATAGKVAYLEESASGNQQITAVTPNYRVNGRYLAWQLFGAADELRSLAPYTTLPIINNDFLKAFPVYVPDLQNQRAVVRVIEESYGQVSELRTAFSKARKLLDEWRQSLITTAMAGQIDVRTAREVDE